MKLNYNYTFYKIKHKIYYETNNYLSNNVWFYTIDKIARKTLPKTRYKFEYT